MQKISDSEISDELYHTDGIVTKTTRNQVNLPEMLIIIK